MDEVRAWFLGQLEKANKGDVAALNEVGVAYAKGKWVEKNDEVAFKYYVKAADEGSRIGMYNVACAYRDGQGVEVNHEQAIHYFEMAAEKGDVDAMCNLGTRYRAVGASQNLRLAAARYVQSAELGSVVGLINVGTLYQSAQFFDEDCARAGMWYLLALEKGEIDAAKQCFEDLSEDEQRAATDLYQRQRDAWARHCALVQQRKDDNDWIKVRLNDILQWLDTVNAGGDEELHEHAARALSLRQ